MGGRLVVLVKVGVGGPIPETFESSQINLKLKLEEKKGIPLKLTSWHVTQRFCQGWEKKTANKDIRAG